jgi:hypothetical protein
MVEINRIKIETNPLLQKYFKGIIDSVEDII